MDHAPAVPEHSASACRSTSYRLASRPPRRRDGAALASLAQSALVSLQHGHLHTAQGLLLKLVALDSKRAYLQNCAPYPAFEPAASTSISIRALGGFAVGVDGAPLSEGCKPQRRPLELLKVLIVSNAGSVAVGKIADRLWSESEGDAARNCLRVAVHRLRQLIQHKDAVVFRDGKISLNRRLCHVDAWTFEEECDQLSPLPVDGDSSEQMRRLNDAVELYRGHLFADEAEPWWILAQRERLRRKWLGLVLRLGECYETQHRWIDAYAVYDRALRIDPSKEVLYRQLMLCQHRAGHCTEIAETYELCRNQMKAGLGRTPDIETQVLYQSLTAG
jgi:DNA-binding SARP family transcriptional activator